MADLSQEFETAAKAVAHLRSKLSNDELLLLYSLYRQATSGDVSGKRPGFTDFAGRAKYDAWAKLENMPAEDAMRAYIDKVRQLQE